MRASPLRRSYYLAALLGTVLFSLSCGGGDSGTPSPTPTSVVVTPGADTLVSVGATRTFTAAVLDANGDPIDGKTVTWSSTAPTILAIDPTTGVATAVANGSAQVHATAGTLQGSANVVVVQIVASVTVTPGNVAFTAVGDTARFSAVAKDAGGTPVVGVQVLWSVSDNTVATIDTLGLAKSKGPGNALVSAQAQTRAGYAALGVDPTVTQFAILSSPATGIAGEPLSTALTVELRDSRGNRTVNSSLAVTVAPAGAASGTPLHGATSVLADQGRATFTNLWFEKAGIDRFKVTVAALPVDSGSLVTVAPGPPGQIHLDSVAQLQTAGVPIGLTARVRDHFGNLATNYNGPVVATPAQTPLLSNFYGDSESVAVAGVATFPSLNFHLADGPWRFTALIPGTPTLRDTTRAMAVLAGPPASFAVSQLGIVRVSFSFNDPTVIHVTDAFGNAASSDSLGDTLSVNVSATGWAYPADSTKAQEVVSAADEPLIGGSAEFLVALRRPGRVRLVFRMPGFLPDTTEEVIPTLPHPTLFSASGTVQSGVMLTDRATCLFDYVTLCAGADDHGVLGTDSAVVAGDSLWIPTDSTPGGAPGGGDGGDRHVCGSVGDFYTGLFHVACWGDNSDGQLGGGSVGGISSIPVVVGGFTSTVAPYVSAGGAHSCAIYDGVAACWGRNDFGQLGTGTAGASTGTATAVTGLAGINLVQISAGGRHTCAVDEAQELWCWGANDFGQLGDSGVGAYSAVPIQVASPPGKSWVSVAAGDDFTCGVVTGFSVETVYCWGRNDHWILGPGHVADSLSKTPVEAQSLDGSTSVSAGAGYACASIQSGLFGEHVKCWGANDHGQLGRGTVGAREADAAAPIPVEGGALDIEVPILGRAHACALTKEDSAFQRQLICWGDNSYGRMGIGRTGGDEPTPLFLQAQY